MPFPKGFLWGAATASHQVEGDNRNDWSVWEKANAERLARGSEAAFAWNPNWERFRAEATNPTNYISGTACDHWNRYAEDFDIVQSLGLNSYRFSIEWSRIEPEPGHFDEVALRHYGDMLAALRERNIEPFVTLWHFTLPSWLAERGGVLSPDFPELFTRYSERVVRAIGHDVRYWITLNEPDVYAGHTYWKAAWPPAERNLFSAYRCLKQFVRGHRLSYTAIKNVYPDAQIGIAKHNIWFEAAGNTFVNRLLKYLADRWWNHWFLRKISDHQDFIGLNHYNHNRVDWGFNRNENKVQTDFGWEYCPESLYHALMELKAVRQTDLYHRERHRRRYGHTPTKIYPRCHHCNGASCHGWRRRAWLFLLVAP